MQLLMQRSITLRHACACAIPACLEALVARALQYRGGNRPYHPFLTVLRVEDDMLFAILDRPAELESWGVYCELPSPHNPLGRRLLGVTTALCAACQAKVAQREAHAHPTGHGESLYGGALQGTHDGHPLCGGCAGSCCDQLTVYFTHMPGFPMLLCEVYAFFYAYFGMDELAEAYIPEEFRTTYDVYRRHHSAAAAAQPARRKGPGAPPLAANTWLFRQICADPGRANYNHLRPGWEELVILEKGVLPVNPLKRFRQAVRDCVHRLENGNSNLLPG